jgi:hypothetical protein
MNPPGANCRAIGETGSGGEGFDTALNLATGQGSAEMTELFSRIATQAAKIVEEWATWRPYRGWVGNMPWCCQAAGMQQPDIAG